MTDFYTLWTDTGLTEVGDATLANLLDLTTAVVGDGNGEPVIPNKSQTALVNEVWSGTITSKIRSVGDPNTIVFEFPIQATEGPFTIREVGLKDDTGQLCIVGNFPETEKPVATGGSTRDMVIRIPVHFENAEVVNLTVDPNVALLTQSAAETLITDLATSIATSIVSTGISATGTAKTVKGEANHGDLVEIPGTFRSMPAVLVTPKRTLVFNPAQSNYNQYLETYAQNLEEFAANRWRFELITLLTTGGGEGATQTEANLSGSERSIYGPDTPTYHWTPYISTPDYITPADCVGIKASGNSNVTSSNDGEYMMFYLHSEVLLEVDGIGTFTLGSFQSAYPPHQVWSWTVAGSYSGVICNFLTPGQYTYRYKMRSLIQSVVGGGTSATMSMSLSAINSTYLMDYNPTSVLPAGSAEWTAQGYEVSAE